DDIGQGGLAEARRAEDQGVIQRFATPSCSPDEQIHLLTHQRLADIIGQAQWADGPVKLFFAVATGGSYQTISFDHERLHHSLERTADQVFTAQIVFLYSGYGTAGLLR